MLIHIFIMFIHFPGPISRSHGGIKWYKSQPKSRCPDAQMAPHSNTSGSLWYPGRCQMSPGPPSGNISETRLRKGGRRMRRNPWVSEKSVGCKCLVNYSIWWIILKCTSYDVINQKNKRLTGLTTLKTRPGIALSEGAQFIGHFSFLPINQEGL